MPGQEAVPAGPHRDLLTALHRLYRLAGPPGLRKISEEIRDSDEFDATLNRNLISSILQGKRLPTALQLDSLARYFASLAAHAGDPKEESRQLTELWMRTQVDPKTIAAAFTPATSVNEALRAASATGDPAPLIKLCTNAAPDRVLKVLGALHERQWVAFAKEVKNSFAETFEPRGIPHLVSEMRLTERYRWSGENILTRFAATRRATESAELVRLFSATGQLGDVLTIMHASFMHAEIAESARLYCAVIEADLRPWTIEDNRGRSPISTKKLVGFAVALTEIGHEASLAPAILQWTPAHRGFQGLTVAVELNRLGYKRQADALLKEALRRGGVRQAKDYLTSEDVTSEDKELFLQVMERNEEPVEPDERMRSFNPQSRDFKSFDIPTEWR
ncbi:hypothetical protein GCM10010302_11920 [Streptomyces polychromogenes]|uniref:Uncharacterized protein n=1 Tax=Streptomyces polychromogenes TaxID=67342 RepID=A0ABN0V5I6_9ACTN